MPSSYPPASALTSQRSLAQLLRFLTQRTELSPVGRYAYLALYNAAYWCRSPSS
jgi:hypothetical protein